MFHQYVVASTVIFAAKCWGADFKAKDTVRLNKLIKKAGCVVGPRLSPWKRWCRIEAKEQLRYLIISSTAGNDGTRLLLPGIVRLFNGIYVI